MQALAFKKIGPLKGIAAFRAAWSGQAAKVVVAKGTERILLDLRPVGNAFGCKNGGVCHGTTIPLPAACWREECDRGWRPTPGDRAEARCRWHGNSSHRTGGEWRRGDSHKGRARRA